MHRKLHQRKTNEVRTMAKETILLSKLLLLRKELQGKVDQLQPIKSADIYRLKAKRVPAAEGLDDLTMEVPLLCAAQVTQEYDFHARKLREVDGYIQQTNWTTEVPVEGITLEEYKPKELKRGVDDHIA
jgi:hypothetical protein